MRFFLLYLATITTAITSPFVDLSLNALSFDSSASQGSEADVLENDPEGTSVSPPNSGVANVDTSLFSSASSGSVIGIRPLSSDIQASVPETENSHQGDIATSKYLRLFLWIPACETLFPGTKPYCCDEKLNKKKGTANGCGHWLIRVMDPDDEACDDPEFVNCCGSWDWISRIAYSCVGAFFDDDGILRAT